MINFLQVEKSVKELKKQLAAGEIDEKSFEDQLLDMVDVAEDGYYWMFGYQSEKWFRHDGSKWVPTEPSQRFASKSRKPSPAAPNKMVYPGRANTNGRHNQQLEDKVIDLGWFIVSLIVLALIGGLVYYTTLIR